MSISTMLYTRVPSFQLFLRWESMSPYNPQLLGIIKNVKDLISSLYIEGLSS